MANLAGIAGSLRKASFNRVLIASAKEAMPAGSGLQVLSIDDVPLYNGDIEAKSGLPDSVLQLRKQIAAADGIVISTPEYNASIPGVLKNVIDWLSRPVEDEASVFAGKPLALMGATPGGLGTALSQAAWLPTLRNLRVIYWTGGGNFLLSRASAEISDGRLSESKMDALKKFVDGFATFADRQ